MLLLILSFPFSVLSALQLEKVIVFSRHGIRVPYQPAHGAANYSVDNREWYMDSKQWGAPGEAFLTDHGKLVLQQMGKYFASMLINDTKLLNGSCASLAEEVTIYADYDNTKRDIETAQAFFTGMYPFCQPQQIIINADPTYVTPLFNQGNLNFTANCTAPAQVLVDSLIGQNASRLSLLSEDLINELSESINCCRPVVCESFGPHRRGQLIDQRERSASINFTVNDNSNSNNNNDNNCTLSQIPTQWNGEYWQYYDGPFFTSADLTEYLELLYLNGMDYTKTTSLTPERIARAVSIHDSELQFTENYWASQAFGSQLLAHITATAAQIMLGVPSSSLLSKPSNKFVYYSGHDLNILFLRNFLRLNWLTESFNPSAPVPGGMLIFELYSHTDSTFYIKTFFQSASYKQQRHASNLISPDPPPDKVFVAIPECSDGPEFSCEFEKFRQVVQNAIRNDCTNIKF